MRNWVRLGMYGNAVALGALALYFLLLPAAILINDLCDPALSDGSIPRVAWRWHRALSNDFAPWARQRVASTLALTQSKENVTGTEWPVYSAVFYLWSTEALEESWERGDAPGSTAPSVYAREAIEAASVLVADPNHAKWVRDYWGAD